MIHIQTVYIVTDADGQCMSATAASKLRNVRCRPVNVTKRRNETHYRSVYVHIHYKIR